MPNQTYPALWWTSNTPITTGQRECAMRRYLGNHAGRHGTGFRKRATAVPLATGSGTHHGIELIGQWLIEWREAHKQDRLDCPDEVVAWAAIEAADGYARRARARGLELTKSDLDAAAELDRIIREQQALIEAQVWIYALVRLPFMLSRARVLNVEHEETPVLDCTCGLGDWVGSADMHAGRGCAGIVMQGKADFIWETFADGMLEYEEFKTKATPNYGWEQQWEHSGQLRVNMEAASKRLGKDVSQAYVPVLFKGRRDRTNRDDLTSPKIQQTPLVHAYFDPGAPPIRPVDWAARYKWYDDWGKGHTLPRTYQRTFVADEANELPAENPNGVRFRTDASRIERWVRGWILPVQYPELLKVLGPFPKPRTLMDDATRSIIVGEREWREKIAYLRSRQLFQPGDVAGEAGEPGVTVADVIPRSWACTNFDGTPCEFRPVCHKEPGWQAMEALGIYEIRTPHHDPEKVMWEELGVVFPEGDEDDDD